MKDSIWQQVLPLLPLGAADDQLTETSRPILGLDALDFVEVVLQVEQQCNIRFSDAELRELRVVQRLLSGIKRPLRQSLYAQFFAQLLQNGSWL